MDCQREEKYRCQPLILPWRLACKGLTVYVTGSREKVVLQAQQTKMARELDAKVRKPRLRVLRSTT